MFNGYKSCLESQTIFDFFDTFYSLAHVLSEYF